MNILKIIKKLILCCLMLYTYNLLAVNINMMIPFNFLNIIIIYLLGVPGFFALIFFKVMFL